MHGTEDHPIRSVVRGTPALFDEGSIPGLKVSICRFITVDVDSVAPQISSPFYIRIRIRIETLTFDSGVRSPDCRVSSNPAHVAVS